MDKINKLKNLLFQKIKLSFSEEILEIWKKNVIKN